ncbi:MAG TPA: TetR/AcrR family transcriptional regulator [Aeromicrobium sp.]|nr:TetR/AcrR family transcriptional regulator [Aeromicrobium sp.]
MTETTETAAPRRRRYAQRLPADERREQLLDAALHVLVREGYGNVTIEAIAREAGVTRPVVYSAFDGLDPLLKALLDRSEQRGLERLLAILAAAGDPSDVDQWVLRAADAFFDEVHAEPDIWRPILGLLQGAPAIVSQRIADTREVIRSQLASALDVGVRLRGRPDLDAEVLSHVVVAIGEEFGRLAIDDPPRFEKDRLLATIRQLLGLIL